MSDLVEFLNARLDEDAQVARDAAVDAGGTWKPGAGVWGDLDEVYPVVYDEGRPTPEQAAHIARHDPARVLADVAARRTIVAEHGRGEMFNDCRRCAPWETAPPYETPGTVDFPCRTLRALALPYAEHPDYRQEWTP